MIGVLALDHLLDLFHSTSLFQMALCVGLALLAIGLVVLIYTRWGQTYPLCKSMALSVLAHLLLIGFSTVVLVAPSSPFFQDEVINVSLSDKSPAVRRGDGPVGSGPMGPAKQGELARHFKAKPWEAFGQQSRLPQTKTEMARVEPANPRAVQRLSGTQESGLPGAPSLDKLPLAQTPQPQPAPLPGAEKTPGSKADKPGSGTQAAAPIQAPAAQRREAAQPGVPGGAQVARQSAPESASSAPVRKTQTGVDKKLLERTVAVPRLDDIPVGTEPGQTLPSSVGQAAGAGRLRPVEPVIPGIPAAGGQAAGMPGEQGTGGMATGGLAGAAGSRTSQGPASAGMGHLRPPSIASSGNTSGQGGTAMEPGGGAGGIGPPQLPGRPFGRPDARLPETYRLRTAPDRVHLAERHGATPETEAAVQAALKWFSSAQSQDGRWNPKQFGAGRETKVADQDRYGAGATADTGLTGLATLAFLAAGNTHNEGPHQTTTRRALEFLLRAQAADGNLAGDAAVYEFMYCHGIAAIALSEAYGMTKDVRLREPVRRAIAYTIAAQDPSGGGWRYRNQEAGDTSQLGWQLMALRSAELAGIAVPNDTWKGVERFLKSVSSGTYRGLASYRPNEQVSRTMTAEALMCRQFLGLPAESATAREAGNYLLGQLPGESRHDAYYWYYGTLAMYELGGVHWQRWNDAMKNTLPGLQVKTGDLAGTWNPDDLWGAYGGRIYSTALATLCLEIYYRYLPLTTAATTPERPSK